MIVHNLTGCTATLCDASGANVVLPVADARFEWANSVPVCSREALTYEPVTFEMKVDVSINRFFEKVVRLVLGRKGGTARQRRLHRTRAIQARRIALRRAA